VLAVWIKYMVVKFKDEKLVVCPAIVLVCK